MTIKTYRLAAITDLLQVPFDRREQCVRDLLYALALMDLSELESDSLKHIDWTDDGDLSVDITNPDGTSILKLDVTGAA